MTVGTQNSSITAEGNGATTVFNYNFLIPAEQPTPVIVQIEDTTVSPTATTILLPTQYAITGLGNPNGGTVNYPLSGSSLVSGQFIIISRNVPYTQTVAFSNQGTIYPESIELGLDTLELQIQQLLNDLENGVVGPPGPQGPPGSGTFVTPQSYGAKGDALILDDGAITASHNTFASTSATFTVADINKTIGILGAGAGGATLITTIAGFTNSHSITLAAAAVTSVTGAHFAYGTDDHAALAAFFTAQNGKSCAFQGGSNYLSTTKQTSQVKSLLAQNNALVFLIGNNTDDCFTVVPPQPGAASQINSSAAYTELYLDGMATGLNLLNHSDGSMTFYGLTLDNSYRSAMLLAPVAAASQFIENLTGMDWKFRNCGFHGMEVHLIGDGSTSPVGAYMNETNIVGWEMRGIGLRFGSGTGATAANGLRLTFDNITFADGSQFSSTRLLGTNWDCAVANSLGGAAVGDIVYQNAINGTTARRVLGFQWWAGGMESTAGTVTGSPMVINGNNFTAGDWQECYIVEGQPSGWGVGVPAAFTSNPFDMNVYQQHSPGGDDVPSDYGRGINTLPILPAGTSKAVIPASGIATPLSLVSGVPLPTALAPTRNYIDPNFTNSLNASSGVAALVASGNLVLNIPIFPLNIGGGGFQNSAWPISLKLYHDPFFDDFTKVTYVEFTVYTSFKSGTGRVSADIGLNHISAAPASTFLATAVTFSLTGTNLNTLVVTIPGGASVGSGGADADMQFAASRWGMGLGQQHMAGNSDNPGMQINMRI